MKLIRGLPVVEGPGPGRHSCCPGSMAQAPALLREMSSPWDWGISPAPVCRKVVWGCTCSVWGCEATGLFPYVFGGSLSSPCYSWKSQPCSAGAPSRLCTAGEAPQAQLKNHLCTSSAPGTAVETTQGTAGSVISAQLAHMGLPQEHIQPQGPRVRLLRAVGRAGRVSLWWFNESFSLCMGQGHGWAGLCEGARDAELC